MLQSRFIASIIPVLLVLAVGCPDSSDTPPGEKISDAQHLADLQKEAQQFLDERKFDEAAEKLLEALSLMENPRLQADTHEKLARLYFQTHKYDAALEHIEKAIEIAGKPMAYATTSCEIFEKAGKPVKAYQVLVQLAGMSGKQGEYYKGKLDKLLSTTENIEAVIDDFSAKLDADPKNFGINAVLAGLYHKYLHQPEKALPYYETMLQASGINARQKIFVLQNVIAMCRETDNTERLISANKDMLDTLETFDFRALEPLIDIYQKQNNRAEIKACLDQYAPMLKPNSANLYYVAGIYKHIGHLRLATEYLDRSIEITSDVQTKAIRKVELGYWLIEDESFDKALALFEEAIQTSPYPSNHVNAALGYCAAVEAANEMAPTINKLNTRIENDPKDKVALFLLLAAYMTETGEPDKAQKTCADFVALLNRDNEQKFGEALTAIQILTQKPQTPRVVAIRVYDELLKAAPENHKDSLLCAAADTRRFLGDDDGGIALLEGRTNRSDGKLAQAYLETGQYDKAIGLLERQAEGPPMPWLNESLIDAYIKAGKDDKAAALLEKALEKQYNTPALVKLLLPLAEKKGTLDDLRRRAQADLQKDPKDLAALATLARIALFVDKDAAKALTHMESLRKSEPNNPLVAADWHLACYMADRKEDAEAALKDMVENQHPYYGGIDSTTNPYLLLAEEYALASLPGRAAEFAEKAALQAPTRDQGYMQAGEVFAGLGDEDRALTFYDKAMNAADDASLRNIIELRKAECLMRFERYKQAHEIVERITREAAQHSDAAHIGKALKRKLDMAEGQ